MQRSSQLIGLLAVMGVAASGASHAQNVASVGVEAVAQAESPVAAVPVAEQAETSPVETVESLQAGLLDIMTRADALGFDGRFDTIRPVVGTVFDLNFMSSKIVGREWKKLTPEQQQLWHDKFQGYLSANYAGNFNAYDGERFEILGAEDAPRETLVVLTKLHVPGDEDVVLNYRLRKVGGKWLIIDIYLKGTVSELALRRSDFSSILKDKGFPELTAALDKKIDDLREKGGG